MNNADLLRFIYMNENPWEELAKKSEFIDICEQIKKYDESLFHAHKDTYPILISAMKNKRFLTVEWLLNNIKDLNPLMVKDSMDDHILQEIYEKTPIECYKKIYFAYKNNYGNPLEIINGVGTHLLESATEMLNLDIIKFLIEDEKFPVNQSGQFTNVLFTLIAVSDYIKINEDSYSLIHNIINLFIKNGVDIEEKTGGENIISRAIYNDSIIFLEVMLKEYPHLINDLKQVAINDIKMNQRYKLDTDIYSTLTATECIMENFIPYLDRDDILLYGSYRHNFQVKNVPLLISKYNQKTTKINKNGILLTFIENLIMASKNSEIYTKENISEYLLPEIEKIIKENDNYEYYLLNKIEERLIKLSLKKEIIPVDTTIHHMFKEYIISYINEQNKELRNIIKNENINNVQKTRL